MMKWDRSSTLAPNENTVLLAFYFISLAARDGIESRTVVVDLMKIPGRIIFRKLKLCARARCVEMVNKVISIKSEGTKGGLGSRNEPDENAMKD